MSQKNFKILSIGPQEPVWREDVQGRVTQSLQLHWTHLESVEVSEFKKLMEDYDLTLIQGPLSLNLHKVLPHRSIGSHFIRYTDCVFLEDRQLWGHAIFSQVIGRILKKYVRDHDAKGPVIFLGEGSLILPTVQTLAQQGFKDFVFLKLVDENTFEPITSASTGLLDIKASSVDSNAFIQSQKEYSLCFVMQDEYSMQTLEDISYFHFLSNQSIVFDFSGRSNFSFKEVAALGVESVNFKVLSEAWASILSEKIVQIALKKG